jgi:hypothetical protein
VSTLTFADPDDRDHVAKLISAFESAGGRTGFVQLLASRETLERRVAEREPPPMLPQMLPSSDGR